MGDAVGAIGSRTRNSVGGAMTRPYRIAAYVTIAYTILVCTALAAVGVYYV